MNGRFDISIDARGVARLAVAHDAKLNTLNPTLLDAAIAALRDLAKQPDLRAAVLTGEGERAFIGGADIGAMAALNTPADAEAFIRRIHGICAAIRDLPVPVIARINGWCLGAGLEVAAACDIRIAVREAKFGMPEVRVGIPSVVEAALLPGLIGWGRTRRLLLLAETISAADALAWGLLEEVAHRERIDARIEAWIGNILAAGPEAMRAQKALIRHWEDCTISEAIAAGITAFGASWKTDEPKRMMRAFLEEQKARKKKP
ncbi:MAG: enoyl-CoA hydratase/isomerase family protein [Roseomonas sp.]|nr:enoyl-CoA hydratase/isomerase family protein [Roseomonas sp.]